MNVEKTVVNLSAIGRVRHFLYKESHADSERFLDENSDVILHADAALNLRDLGYEVAIGIARDGLLYAKIFEIMGFDYSEIDYSCHSRSVDSPEMTESELEKIKEKKAIVLDVDFLTGNTFRRVTEYLLRGGINIGGVYIGDLRSVESSRIGLNEIVHPFSEGNLLEHSIRKDIRIFTYTNPERISEATQRVFQYLKQMRKL